MIRTTYENNREYQAIWKRLCHKQIDYQRPQSDRHNNFSTRYGQDFNLMAYGLAEKVITIFYNAHNKF